MLVVWLVGWFFFVLLGFWGLVESDVTVNDAYESVNQTIFDNGGNIKCLGKASCAYGIIMNSGTSTSGTTQCEAKQSCQGTKLYTGSVKWPADNDGFLATAWSKDVNVDRILGCYGEATCYEISNVTLNYLNGCQSFRACDGLIAYDIYNAANVSAKGALSLHNAILYNPSVSFLYGWHAGYNATIICESGKTCNVYCHMNSCQNINLICHNSSVECRLHFCNDNNGIVCSNSNNDTIYKIGNYTYDTLFDLIDIKFGNGNFLLNNNLYDKYKNIYSNSDCNSTNNDIECADYQECRKSETFEDSIYSMGNGNNSFLNNICCSGYQSCAVNTMQASFNNLYCDASYACASSTIIGDTHDSNIYLRGRYAVENSDVKNFNQMYVTAVEATRWASISNGPDLACFGFKSCQYGNISNVTNIFGAGDNSLADSSIESRGMSSYDDNNEYEMNVYLMGYQSGNNLDITCMDNDICNIYCVNNEVGCDIMTYQCGINEDFMFDSMVINCTINIIYGSLVNLTQMPTVYPTLLPSTIPTTIPTMNETTYIQSTEPASLIPTVNAVIDATSIAIAETTQQDLIDSVVTGNNNSSMSLIIASISMVLLAMICCIIVYLYYIKQKRALAIIIEKEAGNVIKKNIDYDNDNENEVIMIMRGDTMGDNDNDVDIGNDVVAELAKTTNQQNGEADAEIDIEMEMEMEMEQNMNQGENGHGNQMSQIRRISKSHDSEPQARLEGMQFEHTNEYANNLELVDIAKTKK